MWCNLRVISGEFSSKSLPGLQFLKTSFTFYKFKKAKFIADMVTVEYDIWHGWGYEYYIFNTNYGKDYATGVFHKVRF